jgi:lipopolysaccharide O-acetyltransferase
MIIRFVKLIKENGFCLAIAMLCGVMHVRIHSRFLAWNFGVQKISIPPDAAIGGVRFIKMGENFVAGRGLWIAAIRRYQGAEYNPRIIIGDNVAASYYVHIAATNLVKIGSNVLIGSKVLITDHQHGDYQTSDILLSPAQRRLTSNLETIIGDNVWLGDGVVVMPGVKIGDSSVIGANSVVTHDVPSFTVVAGVPAVSLKRFNFTTQKWRKF